MAIFRSQLQGELLARVVLMSDAPTVSDLARALKAPVATVQREVERLERAGLLSTKRVGRARLVSANDANPAMGPLRELVTIAFGPRQVVAEEFGGLQGVTDVVIFGSWAARYSGEQGAVPGDVDVVVVGQPDRDDVYDAAERAQARLARPVNTTLVSPSRWEARQEPFLREIQRRPILSVVTGESVA
jgi:DNA-binding transcriptional ArsR family regulator